MSERVIITVTVQNRLGLHARPAMTFVDTASAFESAVRVRKGETDVDGKSIMEMMMLAATRGTELEITCEGPDAKTQARALQELVDDKFGEE